MPWFPPLAAALAILAERRRGVIDAPAVAAAMLVASTGWIGAVAGAAMAIAVPPAAPYVAVGAAIAAAAPQRADVTLAAATVAAAWYLAAVLSSLRLPSVALPGQWPDLPGGVESWGAVLCGGEVELLGVGGESSAKMDLRRLGGRCVELLFHTHPAPSPPSDVDVTAMKNDPFPHAVLVSVLGVKVVVIYWDRPFRLTAPTRRTLRSYGGEVQFALVGTGAAALLLPTPTGLEFELWPILVSVSFRGRV